MSDKNTISRILQYVKPYKGKLAIVMVCMIIVSSMAGAQAYMVKPMLDEIFFKRDQTMLLLVPLLLLGIFLFKGVFAVSYDYLLRKVGQSVIKDMRNELYAHMHVWLFCGEEFIVQVFVPSEQFRIFFLLSQKK